MNGNPNINPPVEPQKRSLKPSEFQTKPKEPPAKKRKLNEGLPSRTQNTAAKGDDGITVVDQRTSQITSQKKTENKQAEPEPVTAPFSRSDTEIEQARQTDRSKRTISNLKA